MAFNLVDQEGNHRGVIASRFVQKSIYVHNISSMIWLAYITPFGTDDLGFRLYDIQQQLAEAWRIPSADGQFDRGKLKKRLEAICRAQQITGLDEEAQVRLAYIFQRMFNKDERLKNTLQASVSILIDPYNSIIQGDEVIVDLPNIPGPTNRDGSIPIFFQVQESPRFVTNVHYHEMVELHDYSVELKAKSGNVLCEFEIPYPLSHVKANDNLFLHLGNEEHNEFLSVAGVEVEIRKQSGWPF